VNQYQYQTLLSQLLVNLAHIFAPTAKIPTLLGLAALARSNQLCELQAKLKPAGRDTCRPRRIISARKTGGSTLEVAAAMCQMITASPL
jgi:hypothetical protein